MASLRALECLVAVADCGSITEAARLLHSSQPAVSHHLAVLEREVRTPLLRREARGVTLTPAGRAALGHARYAIESAASAVRVARESGAGTGGTLRLACAQSLTVPLVAPVIRAWRRRHPRVTITVQESTIPDQMLAFLDADQADVLLRPGPVPDRFMSTPLVEEEVVLTAPTGHHLARLPSVTLADLEGVPLVHFSPDNGLSAWLDHSLAQAGVRVDPVMRTSVTAAAPQLAAAGLGVAVTPVSAVSAGLPAAVRSFSPRWVRTLVAATRTAPDVLAAQFIADLQARGLRLPRDVSRQLEADPRSAAPRASPPPTARRRAVGRARRGVD